MAADVARQIACPRRRMQAGYRYRSRQGRFVIACGAGTAPHDTISDGHYPETDVMRLPPGLLALDIVGTLLLAAGLYGLVSDDATLGGVDLVPLGPRLIILGAMLMAPLVIYIIRNARERPRR
jgi:hypothetical protein